MVNIKFLTDLAEDIRYTNRILSYLVAFLVVAVLTLSTILYFIVINRPVIYVNSLAAYGSAIPGSIPSFAVEEFAVYFIHTKTNIHPDSAEDSYLNSIRLMSSELSSRVRDNIRSEVRKIKEGNISYFSNIRNTTDDIKIFNIKDGGFRIKVNAERKALVGASVVSIYKDVWIIDVNGRSPSDTNPFGLQVVDYQVESSIVDVNKHDNM